MVQTNSAPATLPRLPWNDCECGCQGYFLKLGSSTYWYTYNGLNETLELRDGHGRSQGTRLGIFKTSEEMRAYIENDVLPRLLKEQAEIANALKLFA